MNEVGSFRFHVIATSFLFEIRTVPTFLISHDNYANVFNYDN